VCLGVGVVERWWWGGRSATLGYVLRRHERSYVRRVAAACAEVGPPRAAAQPRLPPGLDLGLNHRPSDIWRRPLHPRAEVEMGQLPGGPRGPIAVHPDGIGGDASLLSPSPADQGEPEKKKKKKDAPYACVKEGSDQGIPKHPNQRL
jgi:hypothetical protein